MLLPMSTSSSSTRLLTSSSLLLTPVPPRALAPLGQERSAGSGALSDVGDGVRVGSGKEGEL